MLRVPVETFFEVQRINFLLKVPRIGTLLAFSVAKPTSRKFCTRKKISRKKPEAFWSQACKKEKMKKLEMKLVSSESKNAG